MKGMRTCAVCGRDFPLLAEEHYVTKEPGKTGIKAIVIDGEATKYHDAFDCPHCGCQNIVGDRQANCTIEYYEDVLDVFDDLDDEEDVGEADEAADDADAGSLADAFPDDASDAD